MKQASFSRQIRVYYSFLRRKLMWYSLVVTVLRLNEKFPSSSWLWMDNSQLSFAYLEQHILSGCFEWMSINEQLHRSTKRAFSKCRSNNITKDVSHSFNYTSIVEFKSTFNMQLYWSKIVRRELVVRVMCDHCTSIGLKLITQKIFHQK